MEDDLKAEVSRLREELARLQHKRDADRAGRTRAERELRRVLMERAEQGVGGDDASVAMSTPIRPIGIVRSPFPTRMGTPRQGMLAPSTRGRIELQARLNPAEAFTGMEQFSHVWIVFVFHQNTNAAKIMLGAKGIKSKVRPPRLGGARVGLFSTRSPHRPNPIGLTIAKIEKLERGTLHISGVDLVDGTPVLDIKPYLPRYDSIPHATVPYWIGDEGAAVRDAQSNGEFAHKAPIQSVEWAQDSEETLYQLLSEGRLHFYGPGEEDLLKNAIHQVLRLDPRSAYRRSLPDAQHKDTNEGEEREEVAGTGGATNFKLAFDGLQVCFTYPRRDIVRVHAVQVSD